MTSTSSPRPRRLLLVLAAALVASVLPVLATTTTADATPVAPQAVLLPAPVVSPSVIPAGTTATVTGVRCTPKRSTRVYVTLTDASGGYVTATSVEPEPDGTWTLPLTLAVSTAPGTYTLAATCDSYASQAPYRSRAVTVTASTAAPWTPQTPALPNVPNGTLTDVDCTPAAALAGTSGIAGCVAVGYANNARTPVVETWDGTAWTVVAVSTPAGADTAYLSAVDCTATTRCVAVGDATTATGHAAFVAQLAGTTWSTSVLPAPAGEREGSLVDVSCPTSTTCYAIGSTGSLSEGSRYSATTYRLRGTTWTQLADPIPSSPRSGLSALSCAGAQTCVAVGSDSYSYPNRPTAQVFDGTVWHSSTLADVPLSSSPRLSDISCATTSSCVAVGVTSDGDGVEHPLVESLTDANWRSTRVASPDPTLAAGLDAVSCPSARSCVAVGSTGGNEPAAAQTAVAATSVDGRWTIAEADPGVGSPNEYQGVSCVRPGGCVAVGDARDVPLAAVRTSSGWDDLGAAAPDGFLGGRFESVACSGANACTAGGWVARDPYSETTTPFVNRWNGHTWSQQTLPDIGFGRITGVACPTSTVCVAVGWIDDVTSGGQQPLLLQKRSGTAWTSTLLPQADGAALNDVACRSATSCLAVGSAGPSDQGVIGIALTGTTWKVTRTPPTGGVVNPRLVAVSCTAGTCRVVGSGYDKQTFDPRGIDLAWDGTRYTVGPRPPAGLTDLSCAKVAACVAVGSPGNATTATVFDGTTWSSEPLPVPTGAYAQLFGVACADATSCVAVGAGNGPLLLRRTAAGSWTAEPASTTSSLASVACPTAARCVAVGGDTGSSPAIVVSPGG
ncbi:hypothetical protein ACXR2U_09365 [Jatrophihabitans sp. YIM 134969]